MPGKRAKHRTIKVDMIARVEGESDLHVTVQEGRVRDVQLRIFEPPRYFEAFLRGRAVRETPDLVARICGICPVAYQMSAVHALESIFRTKVSESLRALRRLLYCAEWIESHTLHLYMLHAPDFLGFESGIEMARHYPELVKRGLRLKKVGNQLLALLGGRSVHPVSVQVGGFSRVPTKQELQPIKEELLWAREAAVETVEWVSSFEFSDPEYDYTFVALRSQTEYPMNEGRIVSNRGLNISPEEFEIHFIEEQVPYSNALHCKLNKQSYLTGPLARLNLNYDRLPSSVQQVMVKVGLALPLSRASLGIIARSIEILFAIDESLRILDAYEPPAQSAVPLSIVPGEGTAATEAPRGILYHRYRVAGEGTIQDAKIIPPTSQNQSSIEDDLHRYLPSLLHLPNQQVARGCEKLIRSYDPCISCATHFLKLDIQHL